MIKIQLFVSFSFPHWVFDLAFLYIITIHFPLVCHTVVAVTTTYRLNTVKDILQWTNSTHYFLFQKQLQSVLIFFPLLWCRHWEVKSHGLELTETSKLKQETDCQKYGKGDLWARWWKPGVVWGLHETELRVSVTRKADGRLVEPCLVPLKSLSVLSTCFGAAAGLWLSAYPKPKNSWAWLFCSGSQRHSCVGTGYLSPWPWRRAEGRWAWVCTCWDSKCWV